MTDDYEDEWDDVPEKVILAQIMSELQQIRLLLSEGDTRPSDDGDSADTYECTHCGATVTAAERKTHAYSAHKAPADIVGDMFEAVE